jgi:hypothetical protein
MYLCKCQVLPVLFWLWIFQPRGCGRWKQACIWSHMYVCKSAHVGKYTYIMCVEGQSPCMCAYMHTRNSCLCCLTRDTCSCWAKCPRKGHSFSNRKYRSSWRWQGASWSSLAHMIACVWSCCQICCDFDCMCVCCVYDKSQALRSSRQSSADRAGQLETLLHARILFDIGTPLGLGQLGTFLYFSFEHSRFAQKYACCMLDDNCAYLLQLQKDIEEQTNKVMQRAKDTRVLNSNISSALLHVLKNDTHRKSLGVSSALRAFICFQIQVGS